MSTTTQTPPVLGICPDCGTEIASLDVLIRYRRDDGTPALWAECSACGEVVHPE